MPTWVLVQAPQGHAPIQPVFVNRLFHGPAGRTGTPFRVETGFNTFSLRSGNTITAESVVDCPDALEASPFLVALAAMAAAPGAPIAPVRRIAKKKAAKKVAKPKAKKAKAKKPKTAKKAPKRKAAKRKAPKAKAAKPKSARRKTAHKTAARRRRRS
jgi:hypothetical protein